MARGKWNHNDCGIKAHSKAKFRTSTDSAIGGRKQKMGKIRKKKKAWWMALLMPPENEMCETRLRGGGGAAGTKQRL